MAYPAVIGVFAGLLTIGLVRGVMPQIIPMLKSLNIELPLLTRLVIMLSEGMIGYGAYAATGSVFIAVIACFLYKKSRPFKKFSHQCLLCLPIAGKIAGAHSLTLFLRSCGSLLDAGVATPEAYRGTSATVPLIPVRDLLEAETDRIGQGVSIGAVVGKLRRMPPYVGPLLSAGETSGALGTSALRAAGILERDIEHSLKRLTSLIEPVMMAGMGLVIGSIALSIMMPIYDISKTLQT
jgi:type II secretory pathway component PulF